MPSKPVKHYWHISLLLGQLLQLGLVQLFSNKLHIGVSYYSLYPTGHLHSGGFSLFPEHMLQLSGVLTQDEHFY